MLSLRKMSTKKRLSGLGNDDNGSKDCGLGANWACGNYSGLLELRHTLLFDCWII